MACSGRAPYRIEGTEVFVYGGEGWRFFEAGPNARKAPVYGIWIERQHENGANTITELAVPIELIPVD